jgi:putative ABC transport system permease protein
MFQMMSVITSEIQTNNLAAFKSYLDSQEEELRQNTINDIQYGYDLDLTIYSSDTENGVTKLGLDFLYSMIYGSNFSSMTTSLSMGSSVFSEMIDNPELIASQYDVIAGRIASNYDEVVLVVDQNNELSDMVLYALGLKDQSELLEIMTAYMNGQVPDSLSTTSYSYDDLLNTTFKLVLPSDFYEKEEDGNWSYIGNKTESLKEIVDNGLELKIVGILRPSEDAVSSSVSGAVAYTSDLVEYIIQQTNNSQLVKEQMENPTVDILTGLPFPTEDQAELSVSEKVAAITTYLNSLSSMEQAAIFQSIYTTPSEEQIEQAVNAYWSSVSDSSVLLSQLMERYAEESGLDAETIAAYFSTLSEEEVNTILQQMVRESVSQQLTEQLENEFNQLTAGQLTTLFEAYLSALDDSELEQLYDVYMPAAYSDSSYEENLALFGSLDLDNPSSISIYAKDFDSKEKIAKLISDYNDSVEEQDQITYTDYVGLLMSSVSTIVNFVSYALIAFVSISLVVSSIMIGIITYISVLERTKEIGILRAIGASKKDISRVFNAETLIIGLAAGIIGIGISLLLCIPINLIIGYLADVHSIASMPVGGAVALILLSVFLTIIAGLIPSRIAAKKDPVIALRSE